MNELVSLLPIIGIGLLFWLLIIRPQSKRQKALAALQGGLAARQRGDAVLGPLRRRSSEIVDDRIHLRIAEGVTVEVAARRGRQRRPAPPSPPTTETTPGE